MAVLPVLIYPHPMLKQKLPETGSDLAALEEVFRDLVETLSFHKGCVGLAAPQIGHIARALVVDVSSSPRSVDNHGLLCLLNPKVLQATQWKVSREGCLSFPNLLANVKRAQKLHVEAYNEKHEKVDWLARVLKPSQFSMK